MKISLEKYNCYGKDNYGFVLLPLIQLERMKTVRLDKYEILLGWFFWYIEIVIEK